LQTRILPFIGVGFSPCILLMMIVFL